MKKKYIIVSLVVVLILLQASIAWAATTDFYRSDKGTSTNKYGTLTAQDKTTIKVDAEAFFDEYVISNGTVSSEFKKSVSGVYSYVKSCKLKVHGTKVGSLSFEVQLGTDETSAKVGAALATYSKTFTLGAFDESSYSVDATAVWIRTYNQSATATHQLRKMGTNGQWVNLTTIAVTTAISY